MLNSLLVLTLLFANKDLSQDIAELMFQVAGNHPGFRPAHAKGIVCKGTFTASADAQTVARAAHFQGSAVPVTVRFSDGDPNPAIADSAPDAAPRGMAIRFTLPDGKATDIVAISHNGFLVATGEEFLEFFKARAATDPLSRIRGRLKHLSVAIRRR
jgi:catalase